MRVHCPRATCNTQHATSGGPPTPNVKRSFGALYLLLFVPSDYYPNWPNAHFHHPRFEIQTKDFEDFRAKSNLSEIRLLKKPRRAGSGC